MAGEFAGAGPHLDDGFFEFGEDALFLEVAERGGGGSGGGEGAVGGVGGEASVDREFFGDKVVGG